MFRALAKVLEFGVPTAVIAVYYSIWLAGFPIQVALRFLGRSPPTSETGISVLGAYTG